MAPLAGYIGQSSTLMRDVSSPVYAAKFSRTWAGQHPRVLCRGSPRGRVVTVSAGASAPSGMTLLFVKDAMISFLLVLQGISQAAQRMAGVHEGRFRGRWKGRTQIRCFVGRTERRHVVHCSKTFVSLLASRFTVRCLCRYLVFAVRLSLSGWSTYCISRWMELSRLFNANDVSFWSGF